MRITLRGVLLGGSVGILLTTTLLWAQCRPLIRKATTPNHGQQSRLPLMTNHNAVTPDEDELYGYEGLSEDGGPARVRSHSSGDGSGVGGETKNLACIINNRSSIPCRRDEEEVYIPFSFIHSYFEVYGRLTTSSSGDEVFEWSHSYSKLTLPEGPYDPTGLFLNFHTYDVESRERVKCTSAIDGVPISTQWESAGYLYPIQIAQFGLSHYGKFIKEKKPVRVIIEDGNVHKAKWVKEKSSSFKRTLTRDGEKYVFTVKTQGDGAVSLSPAKSYSHLHVFSVSLIPDPKFNFTLTMVMQVDSKKGAPVYIHYSRSNQLMQTVDNHIYFGYGLSNSWHHLTRNLLVDVTKGLAIPGQGKKLRKSLSKSSFRIISISMSGKGSIANLTISSNEHLKQFYDSANWLRDNQDEKGGWPMPVARKLIPGFLEIPTGWYSAMAQGHAISVLVRAAHHSKDYRYLDSAVKATRLFSVNTSQGGIRTYFPGNFVWYEEYPTSPSLFVLNGFMFSLLGLYDLLMCREALPNPSKSLFDEGMRSLDNLLPLFDSGYGSLYDLRHYTTHVAPNLARWDYHSTHVTQLIALGSLKTDEGQHFDGWLLAKGSEAVDNNLLTTAERWKGYMIGKKAKHN